MIYQETLSPPPIPERIVASALMFDRLEPGWRGRIDGPIEMHKEFGCVVGKLYPELGFTAGLCYLKGRGATDKECLGLISLSYDDPIAEYAAMSAEWTRQIWN